MPEHLHSKKSCQQMLQELNEYIDGDLSDELCSELETHLQECQDCTVMINTIKKTIELYRLEPAEPAMPEAVRDRLFHTLDLDEYLK